MKTLLQVAAVIALLTLSVSTAVLSRDLHRVLIDADSAVDMSKGAIYDLRVTSFKVNNVLEELHGVAAHVDIAAGNVSAASTAELIYWNDTAKQTADAARDLRALLARTDRSLNDKLLPDLDRELVATSTAAQFSLESLSKSADALTFQLNDPAIAQMAEHLNQAAFSVADASKSTADTAAHLAATTKDIEDKVHQLTRPASLAKRIGTELLSVAAQLGSVMAGFVK